MNLQRLVELVGAANAQVTVLAQANGQLALLASQLSLRSKRIPGRRVGIFIGGTHHVHEAKGPRSLASSLENVNRLTRDWQNDGRLVMEFLLPRFRLVDAALCLDEVFVASHGAPFAWLPDIYRHFGQPSADAEAERSRWEGVLDEFLLRNRSRPVLLYYGKEQPRRGYDLLLRLAVEEDGCFIHCGLPEPQARYETDIEPLRSVLRGRGALLETNGYLVDHDVAETFFSATKCLVLPYREHYGSSGVMLQALSAGRPVLVPDVGLMAHRVKRHGLGLTYAPNDWADLRDKFKQLLQKPAAESEDRIRLFMSYFSLQQIHAALSFALGDSEHGAVLPGYEIGPPERISPRVSHPL